MTSPSPSPHLNEHCQYTDERYVSGTIIVSVTNSEKLAVSTDQHWVFDTPLCHYLRLIFKFVIIIII